MGRRSREVHARRVPLDTALASLPRVQRTVARSILALAGTIKPHAHRWRIRSGLRSCRDCGTYRPVAHE